MTAELTIEAQFQFYHHARLHLDLLGELGRSPGVCVFRPVLVLSDLFRYLGFALTNGGTGLLFWGFIACAIGQALVYLSIAEMASM